MSDSCQDVGFLAGYRVVDFTQFEAGPSCTEALAWLGAEVVKIENPKTGDPARRVLSGTTPDDPWYFHMFNANKKSLTVDLKAPKGLELVKQMLKKADVTIENMAPGTIERLGLGYDAVKAVNPSIIYCSIQGFGTGSPYEKGLAFDMIAQAAGGVIVRVDFWTYTCINSLRPLPYVKAWADKHKDAGLVVIGVHTPEFSVEKERVNVERAVRDLKVAFPVAIDSGYRIWEAFNNEYWPALYFIDAKGRNRHHHFGEGQYVEAERVLQDLFKERGAGGLDESTVRVTGEGVEAAASAAVQSPETYIGYGRGERFASPVRLARGVPTTYRVPDRLARNDWGLVGSWNIGPESALLETAGGRIAFRFHSRDLHLVLAPGNDGRCSFQGETGRRRAR